MPAQQRGFARKRGKKWLACWYDDAGRERSRGGFQTKTAAAEYANQQAAAAVEHVASRRFGDSKLIAFDRPQSVDELCDLFLEKHGRRVDDATKRKLETQLRRARAAFGGRHPDSLLQLELEDWQNDLSPGSRHDVFRAFRQTLTWGQSRSLITRNASDGIKNPKRKREERRPILPFESWDEIDAVETELDPLYVGIPTFATGTGLRPEEWAALDKTDVDLVGRYVTVNKRYSGGQLKRGTKNGVPERRVPLRERVVEALQRRVPRIDTPILFPAPRGGYIDIERFRYREWSPALRAAGLAPRGPNHCRHTFATWAIISGSVQTAELAVLMGTSVKEIEDTYFRWLQSADERLLKAFDAFDGRQAS